MHLDGFPIWNGVANEGTTTTVDGEGIGHFGNGYYDTDLMSAFAEARRENADDYPPTVKLVATSECTSPRSTTATTTSRRRGPRRGVRRRARRR